MKGKSSKTNQYTSMLNLTCKTNKGGVEEVLP